MFAKPSANDNHPLPRVRRQDSGVDSNGSPVTSPEKDGYDGGSGSGGYYGRPQAEPQLVKRPGAAVAPNVRDKYSDRNVALVQPRPRKCETGVTAVAAAVVPEFKRKPAEAVRQRTPSPAAGGGGRCNVNDSPRERFKDAKEKFLQLEKERMDEQRSALKKCLELRQRKFDSRGAAVVRSAVRDSRRDWPKVVYDSDDEDNDDECNGRYDHDDDDDDDLDDGHDYDGHRHYDHNDGRYDDKRSRNVRRTDRSRDSLGDRGYPTDGYPANGYPADGYPKPRRSRNAQVFNDCHTIVRTYLSGF